MKVAVAGWLEGTVPSGANRRLSGLMGAVGPLLREGESVTLIHGPGPHPELPPSIQTERLDIPAHPPVSRWWHQQRMVPELLRRLEATVLEQGFLPVPRGLPCALSLTIHDLRDLGTYARRSRLLARLGLRSSLRRADAVTVPSGFTKRELDAAFGKVLPNRVVVIPNGVGPRFAHTRPHLAEPSYVLHVGHLEPRKNLHLLLQAWSLLQERGRAPRLILAGTDAGIGDELRRAAGTQVEFVGRVDEERLVDLYAGCAAVVLPSAYEGFGLPALEALAMGKPVLVSDAGALPEVVEEHGTVLPVDDPGAWADAIESIEAGGEEPRRRHAAQFTWDEAARQTLELWRELS